MTKEDKARVVTKNISDLIKGVLKEFDTIKANKDLDYVSILGKEVLWANHKLEDAILSLHGADRFYTLVYKEKV